MAAAPPPAPGLGGPKSRSRKIFAIHDPWMKGLSMGDVDDIIAIYAYAKFYDNVTVFIVNDSPTVDVPNRCIAFKNFVEQAGYPLPEKVNIICDGDANLGDLFKAADDIFWFAPIAYEPAKLIPLEPEREDLNLRKLIIPARGDLNLKNLMLAEFSKVEGRKKIYLQGDYNLLSSHKDFEDASKGKIVQINSNLSNRQLKYSQLLQIIPDRPLVTNKIMEYYPIKLTCFPDVTLDQTYATSKGFKLLLPQRLYVHEGSFLGNNLIQSLDVLGYTLKAGENATTVACRYMRLRNDGMSKENDGMSNEDAIKALKTDTSTPDAAVVANLPFVLGLLDEHPSVLRYLEYTGNAAANEEAKAAEALAAAAEGRAVNPEKEKVAVENWIPALKHKLKVGLAVALVIVSEKLKTSEHYQEELPPNKSINYDEYPDKRYKDNDKTTNAFDFLAVVMIKNGYTPKKDLQNKLIEDDYWDKFLHPVEPTVGGTRRKKHNRTRRRGGSRKSRRCRRSRYGRSMRR